MGHLWWPSGGLAGGLRGPEPPDIYGLPGLRGKDKEDVRTGTLLALRAHELSDKLAAITLDLIHSNHCLDSPFGLLLSCL